MRAVTGCGLSKTDGESKFSLLRLYHTARGFMRIYMCLEMEVDDYPT